MKRILTAGAAIAAALILSGPGSADAQSQGVRASVMGSGGGAAAGAEYVLHSTVGQPAVGRTAAGTRAMQSSFWYAAKASNFLVLAAPAPTSPPLGAVDVPVRASLEWQAVPYATAYHVQLSPTYDFTNIVIDSAGIAETRFEAAGLEGVTTYFWRVRAMSADVEGVFSEAAHFTTIVAVAAEDEKPPERFALKQNYPNPFRPRTVIAFDVAEPAHVQVMVYDLLGRRVRVVVDAPYTPGRYKVDFEAAELPSGMYLYRLTAGRHVFTRQMLLLK